MIDNSSDWIHSMINIFANLQMILLPISSETFSKAILSL